MSWEITDEEILHENAWTTFRRRGFKTDTGEVGNYFFATTMGGCALVIAQNEIGKFILINEYRFLSNDYSVSFPGGGIKKTQTPEEAARAELREEVGYEATELTLLHVFDPDPGVVVDPVYVFMARGLTHVGANGGETTEDIKVVYASEQEIDEMLATNKISSGQALAAWAVYKAHKK